MKNLGQRSAHRDHRHEEDAAVALNLSPQTFIICFFCLHRLTIHFLYCSRPSLLASNFRTSRLSATYLFSLAVTTSFGRCRRYAAGTAFIRAPLWIPSVMRVLSVILERLPSNSTLLPRVLNYIRDNVRGFEMVRLTDCGRRIKEAVCRQIFGLNSPATTSVTDSVCVSHVFTCSNVYMISFDS